MGGTDYLILRTAAAASLSLFRRAWRLHLKIHTPPAASAAAGRTPKSEHGGLSYGLFVSCQVKSDDGGGCTSQLTGGQLKKQFRPFSTFRFCQKPICAECRQKFSQKEVESLRLHIFIADHFCTSGFKTYFRKKATNFSCGQTLPSWSFSRPVRVQARHSCPTSSSRERRTDC